MLVVLRYICVPAASISHGLLEVLLELSLLYRSAGRLLRVAVAAAVENLVAVILEGVVPIRRPHINDIMRYDVAADRKEAGSTATEVLPHKKAV